MSCGGIRSKVCALCQRSILEIPVQGPKFQSRSNRTSFSSGVSFGVGASTASMCEDPLAVGSPESFFSFFFLLALPPPDCVCSASPFTGVFPLLSALFLLSSACFTTGRQSVLAQTVRDYHHDRRVLGLCHHTLHQRNLHSHCQRYTSASPLYIYHFHTGNRSRSRLLSSRKLYPIYIVGLLLNCSHKVCRQTGQTSQYCESDTFVLYMGHNQSMCPRSSAGSLLVVERSFLFVTLRSLIPQLDIVMYIAQK